MKKNRSLTLRKLVIISLLAVLVAVPGIMLAKNLDAEKQIAAPKATAEITLMPEPEEAPSKSIADEWDEHDYDLFDEQIIACELSRIQYPQRSKVVQITPEIREIAKELTKEGNDDLEKTFLLYQFVSENMEYSIYEDWRNTTAILGNTGVNKATGLLVLDDMSGDCTDSAVTLASLLRSIGIEAYIVYGGSDANGNNHAWVAARVNSNWLQVDPTTSDFYSIYDCLEKNECLYEKYYAPLEGMFNNDISLKCGK